jgi:spermidine synthase
MPNHFQPLVRTEGDRRTLEFTPGDIQSEMRLSRPDALVLAYTRAMMCFALFVPRPRHILMVGLGGGSMARFCHRRFPAARITVLELRADVIALRGQFLVPPDDARFQVVHADAADWIARAATANKAIADVIVVDGFDAAGLPPALSGPAFYRDCRRLLAPGGVLAANVFTYDPRHDAPARWRRRPATTASCSPWPKVARGAARDACSASCPGGAGSAPAWDCSNAWACSWSLSGLHGDLFWASHTGGRQPGSVDNLFAETSLSMTN